MGTKVWMFAGGTYIGYDRGEDRVVSGPSQIDPDWGGFGAAGFGTGVDSAVSWENAYAYFFKGSRTIAYEVATNRVVSGPRPIDPYWLGFNAAGFGSGIQAAANFGNGKAFFFKQDKFIRYDIALNKIDLGPQPIDSFFTGFAAYGFGDNLDGAVAWGDGRVFFFKGPLYLGYHIAGGRIEPPLPIALYWPGFFEVGYTTGVRAPLDLLDLQREIWVPGATIERATMDGPAYHPLPWRGVLHTTEGSSIASAVSSFRTTNFWSHLTIDPKRRAMSQHIPLNIGARSLKGTPTPKNQAHCIQIEIAGFAAKTPLWTPSELDFVADVMRRIEDLVPIPRRTSRTFLDPVHVTAASRMTIPEWREFSGWCGHQHCPGENHVDPGRIDVNALFARMHK